MSHYTVGVITKNKPEYDEIAEILEPFDENIRVSPYIKADYEEVKKTFLEELERYKKKPDENAAHFAGLKIALAKDDIESIRDFNDWYGYYEKIDDEGNALSTYNPNSKWDWWEIGGRWCGMLDGEDTVKLSSLNRFPIGKYSEKKLAGMYPSEYDNYKTLITKGDFFRASFYQERYPTFEKYMAAAKDPEPFAFIDECGEWIEPGEMGWFGVDSSTPETQAEYTEKFWEMVNRLPDYYMTIVDCHI